MKKTLILVALGSAVLIGCSGGNLKDKVVGSWRIDGSTLSGSMIDMAKKESDYQAGVKKLEEGRFEFKADGTVTASALGQSGSAGKWTLTDHDIVITSDKGDQKDVPKMKLSDDGSKIHMSAPGGQMEADLIKAN